jgi:hypothetical protein
MLAFCRDLDVQYKTAFVLGHKLREAMASAAKALRIGGECRATIKVRVPVNQDERVSGARVEGRA